MSKQSLLHRQVKILQHLTDPNSFQGVSCDPCLDGIDLERLRLVGTLSLGKRMEKIQSALPRTFEYLVDVPAVSTAGFAHSFPPFSATRYDNAAQFLDYLRGFWRDDPPDPPFLPDLAALEVAIAKVGVANDQETDSLEPDDAGFVFRRHPNSELLRCRFDIRPLFDDSVDRTPPVEREVCLVVAIPVDGDAPRVFEVSSRINTFLHEIDGWQRSDEAAAGATGELTVLLRSLAEKNIVEIRE